MLQTILRSLPDHTPPVLVVQHLPPEFGLQFAQRLSQEAGLKLGSTVTGNLIHPKTIYIATGDYHIGAKEIGGTYRVETSVEKRINGHRPAVDFLFQSCQRFGNKVAAFLLTGMGNDGAKAINNLSLGGAQTFVQNEASSAVFGMPRAALEGPGKHVTGDPSQLRAQLLSMI